MIKFILHGGNLGDNNSENYGFFREMSFGHTKKTNLLMCYFAAEKKNINDKFVRHSKKFKNFAKSRKINFILADEDKFVEQIRWSDVIYLAGGFSTDDLVRKISIVKELPRIFDGKVVGGSSAGANCLAKYYYGNEIKKIEKGLGILNIKTYCHYKPEDRKIVEKLVSYKEKLPLLVLPNYKWVVMYK